MDFDIHDIHAFSLSRRLVLPFNALSNTLASSILHEIVSNRSTLQPETSLDQADSLIVQGWGEYEGIAGQRWEIARDDIVQMKRLRKVPDTARLDELLSIRQEISTSFEYGD